MPGDTREQVQEAESTPDEILMERVWQGDAAAYRALVERYATPAYALAVRLCRDRTEAEAAVQRCFMAIWRKQQPGEMRTGPFAVQLYRAVADQCRDAPPPLLPKDDLEAAICTLPKTQRAALTLFYSAGLSTVQIASILDIGEKDVLGLLQAARRTLREQRNAKP